MAFMEVRMSSGHLVLVLVVVLGCAAPLRAQPPTPGATGQTVDITRLRLDVDLMPIVQQSGAEPTRHIHSSDVEATPVRSFACFWSCGFSGLSPRAARLGVVRRRGADARVVRLRVERAPAIVPAPLGLREFLPGDPPAGSLDLREGGLRRQHQHRAARR